MIDYQVAFEENYDEDYPDELININARNKEQVIELFMKEHHGDVDYDIDVIVLEPGGAYNKFSVQPQVILEYYIEQI